MIFKDVQNGETFTLTKKTSSPQYTKTNDIEDQDGTIFNALGPDDLATISSDTIVYGIPERTLPKNGERIPFIRFTFDIPHHLVHVAGDTLAQAVTLKTRKYPKRDREEASKLFKEIAEVLQNFEV